MFTMTLGEAAQVAGRRFVRVALLPGLIFCFLLVVVASVGGERPPGALLRAWKSQPVEVKAFLVAGFVAAVLLVAAFLDSAQSALLRYAEGRWAGIADRSLGRLGRRCHRLRLLRLADGPAHHLYPPLTRLHEVRPTRLGNILTSAELYPQLRYGIDAVLVWPRLFPLLPGGLLGALATARAELSAHLVRAVLSCAFAVLASCYVAVQGGPPTLLLICLWGGVLLALASYRGALNAAVVYGQHVRVAFDLHRNDLLAVLGEERRPGGEAERDHWKRLCLFWHRGVPTNHQIPPVESPRTAADIPDARSRPGVSLTQVTVAAAAAAGLAAVLVPHL
ncbi:hypothetical protein [Streptomyces roseicoloratus]|uniref:Integral membrane protein n=1 Tax=Streptomyces roseicoloratus TaxID=2508722 RepID=A0ABY9S196_9ACTN|nr:hypothetical protein [Streptomyces roseicoloratus]WMX48186.1 hypothetical protein RGF97_30000 [Streptomyces roseicoloratus]